ncbi:hypothetical protein [uncultured Limosilactobacillus sp.]|uniref:Lreu_0056 family protein n=1 Tax=uncultured Limosilactobacillus sp. TaxID=2837629 RepID=UPI00265E797B|nr:hypothetical protein [uncultured Limosilactobacillus sp.]
MKKIALIMSLSFIILVMGACGRTNSVTKTSSDTTSSLSSSQQVKDDVSLNAAQLTPEQTAALVLYYGDAHMPGADNYDYSANMEKRNQGAVVKIYDRKAVPQGEGPTDKSYPEGAKELYTVKLTSGTNENGHRLNSIYYTIVGKKIYYADSRGSIRKTGVTLNEMVTYAKTHGEVNRILNVAQNTQIMDMRGKVTVTDKDGLTTQQLGTMVALSKYPDWFKDHVQSGAMYYGTHYGYGEVSDYQYVTTNGDLTSYIWFKRDGNSVIIKTIEPDKNQSIAETPMTTTHTTVSALTNENQQNEVNTLADQLKAIDQN